ncbi:MAG: hypothetical protein R3B06_12585 [Kofleriaceae bacterium]
MAMTELDAAQWQRHVTRWRASDQTVPAYCEAHGLRLATMRYKIRRHAAAPTVRVARVERTADPEPAPTLAASAIVIEVGRARVRVERGVDAAG